MSHYYPVIALLIPFSAQICAICDMIVDQIGSVSQIRRLNGAILRKTRRFVTAIVYSFHDVTSYSYFYDICPVFRPAVSFLFLVCSFISFKTSSCPTNMRSAPGVVAQMLGRSCLSNARSRGTGPARTLSLRHPAPHALKRKCFRYLSASLLLYYNP